MKKYNKIWLCLPVALMVSFSCNKTLTLEPVSTISTASFWKTENDAQGALYGMYSRLRNVTATNLYIWGESRSQDMKQSVGNDFTNLRNFDNTLDPTSAGPDWSSLYQVVNDANYILSKVPAIPFKLESSKNRILAEAYTMRAFCYFVAVRTWGAVPLVTDPTDGYDPAKIYKEKSPVDQVFALIKKDIDDAMALYADDSYTTGRNRWSKPGANALKADVYLWTGKVLDGGNNDFTTALNALNAIPTGDVALLDDFGSVFDYTNKGNKEIIMANNFKEFEATGTFMANMFLDAYPPNSDPADIATIGIIGGGSYWTPTDETRLAFSDEDQRKRASFIELHMADPTTGLYTVLYGCIEHKFDGLVSNGKRAFLDDVVLYRYADVLLMKAEAQNALGQDPTAAMNEIRKRAYGTHYAQHVFVSGSKAQNDDMILQERLLEFLYEGKRWWDILRFGKATALIPYFKANPDKDYKYVWPLSLNILSLEPKVTQNEGY